MFYGKHKKDGSLGFFLDTEYCTDFVEITDAEHSRLISEQEKGKQIIRGNDGYPAAVAPESLLTEEEKKERAAARDIPQASDFPDVEVMSLADYKRL